LINFKVSKLFHDLLIHKKKYIKTLSVVYTDLVICATDRGLHFLRIWFKNKVPHHPATLM